MPRINKGARQLATDGRDKWDRQPRETTRAYAYFSTFKDLGPARNAKECARVSGAAVSTVREHSARWRWVERANAWDDHVQGVKDTAQIQAERDKVDGMTERHLNLMLTVQRIVTVEVARYANAAGIGAGKTPDVTRAPIMAFDTIRKALDFSMSGEAKMRGVPTYGWEALPEDDSLNVETGGTQIEMFTARAATAQLAKTNRDAIRDDDRDVESIVPQQEIGEGILVPASELQAVDLEDHLDDD